MKVKLWFIRETEMARLYSPVPRSRNPAEGDFIWLPRSQIEHTTKYPAEGNEWPVHIVTIPEWLGEEKGL